MTEPSPGDLLDEDPHTPADWGSAGAIEWDAYWTSILQSADLTEIFSFTWENSILQLFLKCMPNWGIRSILCFGNGISLEPRYLAACGYHVTALDISTAACAYVAGLDATFSVATEQSRAITGHGSCSSWKGDARVWQELETGYPPAEGELEIVCCSYLDYQPSKSYDLVYTERGFVGFAEADLDRIAPRVLQWTRPGGRCLVGDPREERLVRALGRVGFKIAQERYDILLRQLFAEGRRAAGERNDRLVGQLYEQLKLIEHLELIDENACAAAGIPVAHIVPHT